MQMICNKWTDCEHAKGCSHSKTHDHRSECNGTCCAPNSPRAASCIESNEPQPLINIPGVEFAKEECFLIPVKSVEDFNFSRAQELNVMWLYRERK